MSSKFKNFNKKGKSIKSTSIISNKEWSLNSNDNKFNT